MTTFPLGPWEPDKGPFSAASIDTVMNLNPLANGWGPYPQLQEIGNSLGAQCLGAWYARKADGTFVLLAGTATGLFRYNTATLSWDNISGASAPYNVQSGHLWQAIQFGGLFIVVNLEDPPQVYDIEAAGSFADLAGSPPQAKFIWVAGDFVVLGYLKVGADEFPQDIHWSGINDATYWTIDRKKGSDRQTLPDGDEIMGGFKFPGGARIIQRNAKRALVSSFNQYIFEIKALDDRRGASSPYSIVPISANDYVFWRTDGIYRGDENIPIGAQRVDDLLFDQISGDVDITSLDLVQGVADPFQKVVLWTYLASDASRKVIGWDWELDRFFRLDTAALLVFSSTTPGLSLEADDGFPDDVDTPGAPSFDSRIYRGGAPTLGAFTSSNTLAYYGGPAMAGTIETATLGGEMTKAYYGARIVGNPGSGTTMQAGKGTLADDTLTFSAAVSRSTRTGVYPFRADAFFHRFRISTTAGDTSFTHIHMVEALRPGETGRI